MWSNKLYSYGNKQTVLANKQKKWVQIVINESCIKRLKHYITKDKGYVSQYQQNALLSFKLFSIFIFFKTKHWTNFKPNLAKILAFLSDFIYQQKDTDNNLMFVCLFDCNVSSHSRIYHSFGDVAITGEELQILTYALHS